MSTCKQTLTLITHHHQLTDLIIKSVNLPRQLKNLLAAISSFYNLVNDNAYPTRKALAERTGYSVNHITYLISYAIKAGVLESTPRFTQDKNENAPRQSSNNYRIILSAIGVRFSKTKALLNKNLRKQKKEDEKQEQLREERVDHINTLLDEVQEPQYLPFFDSEVPPPK